MAAFTRRGLAVSPHKVGPDYIDPGYHSLATGRAGRNLDAYMCGPELVAPLFAHGARGCDLAIVEGVMGLYDGAGIQTGREALRQGGGGRRAGQGELASTAHVAKLLQAPVVLVVDASSQSRSVAALVHGFASWDPEVRISGVILNKVGSDRHEMLLRDALDESGVPVMGVLRRAEQVATPSRHLGLVPVAERRGDAVAAVAAMGAQVSGGCDLDALMALARSAPGRLRAPGRGIRWRPCGVRWGRGCPRHDCSPPRPLPEPGLRPRPRFSDAGRAGGWWPGRARSWPPRHRRGRGPAFTFSYAEHSELLAAAGAEVVTFDPLRDVALPEGTRGLVIGGGFPEVYAPSCPPTSRSARPLPISRPPGHPSPPSAPGCSICRVRSTDCRCAGCSTPTAGCRSG